MGMLSNSFSGFRPGKYQMGGGGIGGAIAKMNAAKAASRFAGGSSMPSMTAGGMKSRPTVGRAAATVAAPASRRPSNPSTSRRPSNPSTSRVATKAPGSGKPIGSSPMGPRATMQASGQSRDAARMAKQAARQTAKMARRSRRV